MQVGVYADAWRRRADRHALAHGGCPWCWLAPALFQLKRGNISQCGVSVGAYSETLMLCVGTNCAPVGLRRSDTGQRLRLISGDFRDGAWCPWRGSQNWYGRDVEVFLASSGTLARGFLRARRNYAFPGLAASA